MWIPNPAFWKLFFHKKAFLLAELIPTAGHCVMLDTPGELNTIMQRFIKKWNTDIPLATTLI